MPFLEAMAPAGLIVGVWLLLWTALPRDRLWVRWCILAASALVLLRYFSWRFPETVLPVYPGTFQGAYIWFLFLVEVLFLLDYFKWLVFQCRFVDRSIEADRREQELLALPLDRWPSVDVFIPTYNEPLEVLERSIVGALALDYPNFKVHVLDDGKRAWLREFCEAQGANYIIRPDNRHAKAGNMNHALTVTSAEFIAIFDADFVPLRRFLRRTVGMFHDPGIGIVQTPQHFFNRDPVQHNLWVTDHWPDEQRNFFDRMAPVLDAWDSMFCCGSCSITRRAALDRIGGFPTASVTEDILTTLEMVRTGYHTRYLNERLSIGLAAESLDAFYVQRGRWCQGGLQTLFLPNGPLGGGLSIAQHVGTFPIYWLFHLPTRILLILVPILYFGFDIEPITNVQSTDVMYWQFPVLFMGWAAMIWYNGRQAIPFLNEGTAFLVSLRLLPVVALTLVKPFGHAFKVTPKGIQARQIKVALQDLVIVLTLLAITVVLMWINLPGDFRVIRQEEFQAVAYLWGILNVFILTAAALTCFEFPVRRHQERFDLATPVTLSSGDGALHATLHDISLSGAMVNGVAADRLPIGESVDLDLPDVGRIPGLVVRHVEMQVGIRFADVPQSVRNVLIRRLYTYGVDNAAKPGNVRQILMVIVHRLFGARPFS